jgi:hypothetical protein
VGKPAVCAGCNRCALCDFSHEVEKFFVNEQQSPARAGMTGRGVFRCIKTA